MDRRAFTRRTLLQGAGAAGALAVTGAGSRIAFAAEAPQQHGHFTPVTKFPAAAGILLEDLVARGCQFYWDHSDPQTGLTRDRGAINGQNLSTVASIASTGFALSALCIAAQRGILPQADCEARVLATLTYLLSMENVHGFYYHFIDMHTGARQWQCELSSVDTAWLLCGVLTARQYFQSAKIQQLATEIYNRVDWNWMANGGPTLTMGWKPESGFLSARWNMFAELFTMYLLAIGSPTHALPKASWDAINRTPYSYAGIEYMTVQAPIFIHQWPHAWVNYCGQQDNYLNYFDNSVKATRAHQLFCVTLGAQYPWFNQDTWGITASDGQQGYMVWGGPPEFGGVDGTLVPSAAAGSLIFSPAECVHVLMSMKAKYPNSYCKYGFVDAFNPGANWYGPDILGIDQGVSVLMAENLRSGFVQQQFMKNPEITNAMKLVNFHPVSGDNCGAV